MSHFNTYFTNFRQTVTTLYQRPLFKNGFYLYLSGLSVYVISETYRQGFLALREVSKSKSLEELDNNEVKEKTWNTIYEACNKDMLGRIWNGIIWPYRLSTFIIPGTVMLLHSKK